LQDMKAASLNEIKRELKHVDPEQVLDFCLRLAKHKKENKELLTYLLFESGNESSYVANVKHQIDEHFLTLPKGNVYFVKKTLRKILRFVNRQVKYSGIAETELDLRIYFCHKIKSEKVPMPGGTVLYNLYQQQLKRIHDILNNLPEDFQADYDRDIKRLAI
jgi:hypothetical protein